jgi:hypothetical protein
MKKNHFVVSFPSCSLIWKVVPGQSIEVEHHMCLSHVSGHGEEMSGKERRGEEGSLIVICLHGFIHQNNKIYEGT